MSCCTEQEVSLLYIIGKYGITPLIQSGIRKRTESHQLPFRISETQYGIHAENILAQQSGDCSLSDNLIFQDVDTLARECSMLKARKGKELYHREYALGMHIAVSCGDMILTMVGRDLPIPRNFSGAGECCLSVSFVGPEGDICTEAKTFPVRFRESERPFYKQRNGALSRWTNFGLSPNPFSTYLKDFVEEGDVVERELVEWGVEASCRLFLQLGIEL